MTMSRNYIVSSDTKDEILNFSKDWDNEFPEILVQVNRRTDGYSININGKEDDVLKFISKLQDTGVKLND
jgi:hypothetical protein